jgi:hypothetical protein
MTHPRRKLTTKTINRGRKPVTDTQQPRFDRAYALKFAHGALHHYYVNDPVGLGYIEPNTNLTTGDLLATAVEMLLEQVDPGGSRPWLSRPATSQWRPGPTDRPTTVTMTDV